LRGFVVGTIVTAIAFFILTRFLPQFVSYGGDLIGLIVISVVFGVVNGLIGPIVRLMALPIRMATLGLVGFLINAGLLLLTAWISSLLKLTDGRRLPADVADIDTLVAHRRRGRPEPRQHRSPACHPRLRARTADIGVPVVADAPASGSAYGTPVVTDLATLDRAATSIRHAFPDPWLRQYRSRPMTSGIVAEVASRGFGANVVSRGEWAIATGRGRGRSDHARGRGQDRRGPAGCRPGSGDRLSPARVALESPTRWRSHGWRGGPGSDATIGRRSPPVRLNGRDARDDRRARRRRWHVEFGMTETEATALVEWITSHAGGAVRPRGVHLHVGSQLGAVDAWRDAVRRGLAVVGLLGGGLAAFDTLDVGGGFPVLPLDEVGPEPGRFARELPSLLEAVPE
jgi:uncharacterized membrane protein YvlD (DUF360 family)